ncbi:hypothetical protein HDV05_006065 [Chytridiales sp. JEL 0842]|nr:hypothetical protein HDV05_006065 [Chytridiales sp. JEL 0842]
MRGWQVSLFAVFDQAIKNKFITASETLSECLRSTFSTLEELLPDLSQRLQEIERWTFRCRRFISHAPTTASSYVTTILSPALDFFASQVKVIPAPTLDSWKQTVADGMTTRYCAIISKILTAAAKTEQFYRKQKKQKGSGGGGGGDDLLLASEKIRAQTKVGEPTRVTKPVVS